MFIGFKKVGGDILHMFETVPGSIEFEERVLNGIFAGFLFKTKAHPIGE
jgi:hypothetical protein